MIAPKAPCKPSRSTQRQLKPTYSSPSSAMGKDGGMDPRFSAMLTDPRFARFPKKKNKVEIDERFAGELLWRHPPAGRRRGRQRRRRARFARRCSAAAGRHGGAERRAPPTRLQQRHAAPAAGSRALKAPLSGRQGRRQRAARQPAGGRVRFASPPASFARADPPSQTLSPRRHVL